MKKILAFLLAVLMLFSFTACSYEDILQLTTVQNFISTINGEKITTDFGEDSIKIGVFEPQTGKYYLDAAEEIKGIKLANRLYPEVLGRKVELIYADNQSDPAAAVSAAQELVDAGCKIVIGSYSNVLTMAAMDVFSENKVCCICPSCTNPLITTTSDYMFRVAVVDSFQGNSAAKYVIEYLPKIVHPQIFDDPETEEDESEPGGEPVNCIILKRTDDERASALIERFQAKMEETFGEDGYARVVEYPASAEDMSMYLERLKESGAEAVFFPSKATEGERVIRQAYEKNYNFAWVGAGDWEGIQEAAETAGRPDQKHLEGVAFVADFDKKAAATEVTTLFLSAAQSYYGIAEPSENMALAFDAYLLAIQGITDTEGDENKDSLREAINRFRDVLCSTGAITYRAGNGDPVKDVVIEKIQDGKIRAEYTATPIWG